MSRGVPFLCANISRGTVPIAVLVPGTRFRPIGLAARASWSCYTADPCRSPRVGTIRVTGLVAVTEWGGLMPSESPPCMGMHGESQATLVETKALLVSAVAAQILDHGGL